MRREGSTSEDISTFLVLLNTFYHIHFSQCFNLAEKVDSSRDDVLFAQHYFRIQTQKHLYYT